MTRDNDSTHSQIRQVLDRLIAEAPEDQKGSIQAQIVCLIKGTNATKIYAGSVRRHPDFSDIYIITTIGQRPSASGRPEAVAVDVYLDGSTVMEVHVEGVLNDEPSRLVVPEGAGKVIPARRQ